MSKKEHDKLNVKPSENKEKGARQNIKSGGVDYSKGSAAYEELLAAVGYSLINDYQDFNKINKNQNLKQLFN
ncbi:MAG: hypothetical protein LBV62_03060 [Rickettsiales bacterium]|jgi:hypothetical protein|nr:hypothetical protein [Rickettsiales bacterium]